MSTTIEMDLCESAVCESTVCESAFSRPPKKSKTTRSARNSKTARPSLAESCPPKVCASESPPPTFVSQQLEEQFIALCQLVAPVPVPTKELKSRRLELLKQASRHIYLPEFARIDAAVEICGEDLLLNCDLTIEGIRWNNSDSLFASLCANRVLSIEEERSAFRRMNYFKYLAKRLLRSSPANAWQLTRAAGLIQVANWHRELILKGNMRLIVSIVRKLPVHPAWHEELVSDGVLALLRAVDRFDTGRGYRFCTYATPVIRRDCFLRIHERKRDRSRSNRTRRVDRTTAPSSHKEVDSSRDFWITWRNQLSDLLRDLSARERLIVRSRYAIGSHKQVKTLQRLADVLKISKERVRQIEQRALAKLRAAAKSQLIRSQDRPAQIASETALLNPRSTEVENLDPEQSTFE